MVCKTNLDDRIRTPCSTGKEGLMNCIVVSTYLQDGLHNQSPHISHGETVALVAYLQHRLQDGENVSFSPHSGFPPMKSLHLLTSGGMTPSFLAGIFSFMHCAKSRAVYERSRASASDRLLSEQVVEKDMGRHTLGSMKSMTPKSTAFLRIT